MATVNKRVKKPQDVVINGVDAGGTMTAMIQFGYENILRSSPDGLEVALQDKEIEFVRGTIVSQDWIQAIELLTGTLGTLVFYESKSGVAAATGYIKHTITNPVIHSFALSFDKGGYATVAYSFECRAADEAKGITDMHAVTDDQAAPTYIAAARGGWRIVTAAHAAASIYHLLSFNFGIAMNIAKACNDADIGYTCVDAEIDNMACGGSISFQDAAIATSIMTVQSLVTAARGTLVITVRQGQGATSKVITIAGVEFSTGSSDSDVNRPFSQYPVNFNVSNNTTTQLTLEGANKIITIEDAV